MQIVGECYLVVLREQFINSSFCIFSICQLVGYKDIPMTELIIECPDPLCDAGLTGVDFLTTTYQTDYDGPILALVERPDEELGLRHREVGYFEFVAVRASTFQIVGNTFVCPAALSFVEDGHVLHLSIASMLQPDGFFGVNLHHAILHGILYFGKHIVAVAVDDLDELADFASRVGKTFLFSPFSTFLLVIAGQCFGQHSHQRAVARKVNSSVFLI